MYKLLITFDKVEDINTIVPDECKQVYDDVCEEMLIDYINHSKDWYERYNLLIENKKTKSYTQITL